jgi:hypothetical protein
MLPFPPIAGSTSTSSSSIDAPMRNPYLRINREPKATDRIKVALVFVVGFGGLAVDDLVRRHRGDTAGRLLAAAGVLAILALLPVVGRWVYIAWMGLGVTIGVFTQPIFLLLAYVLLFVPLGLFFRLIGRDSMQRRLRPPGESYWEDYDESEELSSYFKPY